MCLPGFGVGLIFFLFVIDDKENQSAARLELDELVILTRTYDPEPRHRSYEFLARAFGLPDAIDRVRKQA